VEQKLDNILTNPLFEKVEQKLDNILTKSSQVFAPLFPKVEVEFDLALLFLEVV